MVIKSVTVCTGCDICRRIDDADRLRICRSRRRRRRWGFWWRIRPNWGTMLFTCLAYIRHSCPNFPRILCSPGAFISWRNIEGCYKCDRGAVSTRYSADGRDWNSMRCGGAQVIRYDQVKKIQRTTVDVLLLWGRKRQSNKESES